MMPRNRALKAVSIVCALGLQVAIAQDVPPIFNDFVPGVCAYANTCGECNCSPHIGGSGWPCNPCSEQQPGWWPFFSALFYHDESEGFCFGFNFDQLPLLDLPGNHLEDGTDPGLESQYAIRIGPILIDTGSNVDAALDRVREVPLECSPDRNPVDAAARYRITLEGFGSGADCNGAVFFLTAEYNPTLFDVTLSGRIRVGSSYNPNPAILLSPSQPRLIIGTPVFSSDDLRFDSLIVDPEYVKVALKPGRSVRDAGSESVKVRAHVLNWGGDHDFFCEASGDCPEYYVFQQTDAVSVQVFELELPPNWCQEAPPLRAEDALPISTLTQAQRQAAVFEGLGSRLINDLTAELPVLRAGHDRFRAGRTLAESLGNVAYWHNEFSVAPFVRISLFGVWCAVEDLPGWTFQTDTNELRVIDPCEGLTYHYRNPAGGPIAGGMDLRLEEVTRGVETVRTYAYPAADILVASQTDGDSNVITYNYQPFGNGTQLTVTGTAAGISRQVIATFDEDDFLQRATWNGGPDRQYEYIFGSGNPALDGKIDRVLDGARNVLLDFEYDDRGRLRETTRGAGPTLQILSRQSYLPTQGGGGQVGDTFMVNQCYVNDTEYQATVYTFDTFNRIVEMEEFHDLQTLVVNPNDPTVPAFTGASAVTTTLYRENEDLDVPGGFYTVEKQLPSGLVAEYTVFDSNFNVLRTFRASPGLAGVSGATLIDEKRFTHQQFADIWQTTSETVVARDNATTIMQYDGTTGFLTSRTMPSISAANSGSGQLIPGQAETYGYDPVNRKLVNTPSNPGTRRDGEGNIITIRQSYDTYDYPSTLTEEGACGTRVTETAHNAFGDEVSQTDADAYVTVKVYDEPGHPNNGSGLLLGQYTYAAPGGPGPVVQQTKYFYFTSGANTGRLDEVWIADHVGSFTLNNPAGWQVTAFAYDVYGRVTTKTTTYTAGPGTYVWTYAYDHQDRVRQITYPDDGRAAASACGCGRCATGAA